MLDKYNSKLVRCDSDSSSLCRRKRMSGIVKNLERKQKEEAGGLQTGETVANYKFEPTLTRHSNVYMQHNSNKQTNKQMNNLVNE